MGDHGSYTTNPLFSESLWDEWNWIDSIEFALEWSMEGTSYRPHSASVLQKSETIIQPRPFIASKNGVADSSSNIPIISAPKPVESVPMPFSSGLELPPLLLSSSLTTLTADEILSLPFPGPLSNTDYCGSNCSSSWSHATSSLGGGDEMEEREEERVSSVSLEGGSRARQESISSLSDETLERSSHVVANDISIPPTDFEKSLAQVLLLNGKPVKKDPQFSCPSCDRVFSTLAHVKRHEKIHAGVRPFCCLVPRCPRTFTRRDNMLHHSLSHAKNRGITLSKEEIDSTRTNSSRKRTTHHKRKRAASLSTDTGSTNSTAIDLRRSKSETPLLELSPRASDECSSSPFGMIAGPFFSTNTELPMDIHLF